MHRHCFVARGEPAETRASAAGYLERLDPASVLWIGEEAPKPFVATPSREVRALLGQSFAAVVLDLHAGLNADVFGQCHGLVWGGGAILLLMPRVPPSSGGRFWARFERSLRRGEIEALPPGESLIPSAPDPRGTDEQSQLITRLADAFRSPRPTLTAVLADRGRGKSSALGLALRAATVDHPLRSAITAPHPKSAAELLRFLDAPSANLLTPAEVLRAGPTLQVVLIDEAAQLAVPLLRRIVERHRDAHIAFATTARGYEGTGRGFVLRFLDQLRADERPLEIETLYEPIRWSGDDPVEHLVFDALALDASPADLPDSIDTTTCLHRAYDRDALANDEPTLRQLFGLLVHAHYRTTPSDLQRLLDAPNMRVHALLAGQDVVAASLIALEGELDAATSAELYRGARRIRGHALPETLICHSGDRDAGALSFVRSVRIAVHPELRRRGLATQLVNAIHDGYTPDFFGTLFGATAGLLEFRRSVGYEVVRVGSSRGVRTGEPTAIMLRPVSARASARMPHLRAVLARDLPIQRALARADDELPLDADVATAFELGLPAPADLNEAEARVIVGLYASGPRTYPAAASAIERLVRDHPARLAPLTQGERTLIDRRVVRRLGWAKVAAEAGFETVPAVMRAMRRAVRAFLAEIEN